MAKEKREGKGVPAVILVAVAAVGATLALYFATKAKAAPPEGYVCPYCGETFATYDELVAHVQTAHAGERIPIPIIWE